jgi:hypothetical protein
MEIAMRNAFKRFMPVTDDEIERIRQKWRQTHPNIANFWHVLTDNAKLRTQPAAPTPLKVQGGYKAPVDGPKPATPTSGSGVQAKPEAHSRERNTSCEKDIDELEADARIDEILIRNLRAENAKLRADIAEMVKLGARSAKHEAELAAENAKLRAQRSE